MTGNASRTSQRCLWKPRAEAGDHEPLSAAAPTYDEILHQCHTRPHQKSLYQLCSNSLVIVQEICLTVYILVQAERIEQQHRQKQRTDLSNGIMFAALLLVLFYSSRAERSQQARRVKLKQRSIDGLLLAVLLRYIASLLQSLTASYSTDTVQNLAYSGMVLHLLACDYSYANGRLAHSEEELSSSSRPHFLGGTMSLNAALFSTTLLVSRLSPISAYFIMSLSVVIFAFYPVTRNAITASYPASKSPAMWLITGAIFTSTAISFDSKEELLSFLAVLVFVGIVIPSWKLVTQQKKVLLRGPWDIPKPATMQVDYRIR